MKLSQFFIGEHFYVRHLQSATGWAKWRVTDKGTRTVTAIRVDVIKRTCRNEAGERLTFYYDESGAIERGFFNGPPYGVAEHVFDEHGLPHCHPQPEDP